MAAILNRSSYRFSQNLFNLFDVRLIHDTTFVYRVGKQVVIALWE